MTVTLTAHVGYAYSPRQGARSVSRNHAILDQPLNAGRFTRDEGDALCRPRRKFWGLESSLHEKAVTCPNCKSRATRYGVTLPTAPEN